MCKINYEFEENPPWRRGELPTTTEMVREITQWRKRFANPSGLVQRRIAHYAKIAAVDYVHNLNKGEMVGTQTRADTQEIIEELMVSETFEQEGKGKKFKETINIFKAMKHLFELHEEKEKKGLIAVEEINDTHRILLKDLHSNPGKIRETVAFTQWNNEDHYYPPPELVDLLFYALIFHHTECVEYLHQSDTESEEYTENVFKCAARLMFEFVDAHPYGNGNGRMSRLLASYVLRLITPFPVTIYHSDESRSAYDDYVNAIVRCRDNPEEGPRALAAMLVEGAWYGWKKLIAFVEKSSEVSMVIKKRLFQEKGEEYISQELGRYWKALEMKGIKMSKEDVTKKVVEVVSEVNTTSLACHLYMETKIQLETDIHFFLNVYN